MQSDYKHVLVYLKFPNLSSCFSDENPLKSVHSSTLGRLANNHINAYMCDELIKMHSNEMNDLVNSFVEVVSRKYNISDIIISEVKNYLALKLFLTLNEDQISKSIKPAWRAYKEQQESRHQKHEGVNHAIKHNKLPIIFKKWINILDSSISDAEKIKQLKQTTKELKKLSETSNQGVKKLSETSSN